MSEETKAEVKETPVENSSKFTRKNPLTGAIDTFGGSPATKHGEGDDNGNNAGHRSTFIRKDDRGQIVKYGK